MQTTLNFFLACLPLIAITAACSSSSSGASGGNASCDSYANAILAETARCSGPAISSDEKANYVSRFRTVCTEGLSAPGSGITTSYLDACAGALGKNPACTSAVPECNDPAGTLANGAACGGDEQCQSTHCAITATSGGSDGGSSTTTSNCGTCAATIADGAACAPADTCALGDQCSNGICVKDTTSTGGTGPIGSACQGDSDCASPNHCDFTQGTCAVPGSTGASCIVASDCTTGLICSSGQQCETPVASGGQCNGGDCASGLGCDATTHKCATITFAAQGAACDRDAILCDRGSCNINGSGGSQKGTCPTIIADSQACTANSTTTACDDFASCTNGTCQIANPASCK